MNVMQAVFETSRSRWAWPIAVGIGIGLAGCSKPASYDKYNPTPEIARHGLEAVLRAWQKGEPPGMVADTKPQVHITDAHRKPGQKLEKYQILGEVPGDAPRCFAVKAIFSNPTAEERIRFVVIGIDPLWIFRHEDFELLAHWDHKMDPETDEKQSSDSSTSRKPEGETQSDGDKQSLDPASRLDAPDVQTEKSGVENLPRPERDPNQ